MLHRVGFIIAVVFAIGIIVGFAAVSKIGSTYTNGLSGETVNHVITDEDRSKLLQNINIINVKNYGALGNGITDDTNAFKAALKQAIQLKVSIILIPIGNYIITDTLNVPSGIRFVGQSRDGNSQLKSQITRKADITVFNCSGVNTFTNISHVTHIGFEQLYFADYDNTEAYTNKPFMNWYFLSYALIRDCHFSNKNKQILFTEVYDSRIINTDFWAGGNQDLDIAAIEMRSGLKPTATEIGWDNTNNIIFENCRFESYKGTAVKIADEMSNQTDNSKPVISSFAGRMCNYIYFDKCKFESAWCTTKPHLDFKEIDTLYVNIMITGVEGMPSLPCLASFANCTNVYGSIKTYYNQTKQYKYTPVEFANPILKMINTSAVSINLMPAYSSLYKLDYLCDINPNDASIRAIDIKVPLRLNGKRIHNLDFLEINPRIQGPISTYLTGNGYNGLRLFSDSESQEEWKVATEKVSATTYSLGILYRKDLATVSSKPLYFDGDSVTGKATATFGVAPVMTQGIKLTQSITDIPNDSGRTTRYIGMASAIPTNGIWIKGDILYNTNPLAGGYIGWVCLANGMPGTWKQFGLIEE